jgi:zinc and cadmium transporter
LNLIGDGIHNFVDGMLIAASFLVSASLGLIPTLAVVFHEIPQELGDFGISLYGGLGKKKALTYNFLSATTAVPGALVTYFLVEGSKVQIFAELLVPFAAGGFIYIAATDLMPELHKRTQAKESLVQLAALLAGIALMFIIAKLLPH